MTTRRTFTAMMLAVYGMGAIAYACSNDPKSSPSDDTSSGNTSTGGTSKAKPPATFSAKATISPTTDASNVFGTAGFVDNGAETTVTVDITGGGFPGNHGFHIHEHGSCDPDTADGGPAMAAGGHWNPTDAGHGLPTSASHHLGDLGNITIDGQGKGTLTLKSKEFYVRDGGKSVVGHSVIFHEMFDDGVAQPAGNSGARMGCGVIEPVEVKKK